MNILEQIVEYKRDETASRRLEVRVSSLMEMEHFHRQPVSLRGSLLRAKPFAIIAEIKRSSPSAGMLNASLVPEDFAREYENNGAAAISVLTDERFFSGSLGDLLSVRRAVTIPVLRKDFITDEYQLFEAKSHGADAVLLIAAILARTQLCDLFTAAQELKLECLIELYERGETDKLDFDRMKLVGINNRNLRDFRVDLNNSLSVAQVLPNDVTIVSESGIQSSGDLMRLHAADIHAALIGEHLMKAKQPGQALKTILDEMRNAPDH